MNRIWKVSQRIILALASYIFILWIVVVAGFMYVFLLAQLHNFALAFIGTFPAVLIVCVLLWKYVIKSESSTLPAAVYDTGLAHYFMYGFMLVSVVVSFFIGAWYNDSDIFVTPITKQAWSYDQCAFLHGAGGNASSSKSWYCILPDGEVVKHP